MFNYIIDTNLIAHWTKVDGFQSDWYWIIVTLWLQNR